MKLYYMPGACSLAGHITLEWIGKPYEARKMSHDDIKKPEYLKINPAGAVPALEHDGWVLTQNAAILNYLVDSFPESGLGGDGSARERAEVNRWLGFLNADVHPVFKPLFGTTAYLDNEKVIDQTKAHARAALRKLFERADAQLASNPWLAGPRSIADPYLFVVTRWAKGMKVDLFGLDHLEAWFKRMRGDAGVHRALEAEGLA